MKNPSRFLEILALLTAQNDADGLDISPKALYRAAQIQLSRESQRIPASLGGTLAYADPTGNEGCARAMRTNRKRVAA